MRSLRAVPVIEVPFNDLAAMSRDVAPELNDAWRQLMGTSAFTGGVWVERFEEAWARYCGTSHAIGVANGTDAIEIALRALGIGPGDEVIVPANTFIATAEGVINAGATPRFVDVDPETLLITPSTIDPAVTERTAAVIAVELYGNMPDMGEVGRLARRRGLALIEDSAQAHGATWMGQRAGSFGIAACFSFYPGKNLGAFGDGGAIVTSDRSLAARIRSLADHGRAPHSKYVHIAIGRNSRLDALQAAILSAKLNLLDSWNSARRDVIRAYRAGLDPDLVPMVAITPQAQSAHHLNVVRVRDREALRRSLSERGIETGIHYPVPCHLEEPYQRFGTPPLPVAEDAADSILSLPLFPHMSPRQIEYVCDQVSQTIGWAGRGGAA